MHFLRSFIPQALVMSLPLLSGPVYAGPLDEPHLDIIPRTADETARIADVTAPSDSFNAPSPFEVNSGGAATVRPRMNADAFSQASGNMSFEDELTFKLGNGLFRKLWVSSPSSTLASDGLGPLFNARSCQSCHIKDGRGHPPEGPDDSAISMFLRVSIPGNEDAGNIKEIEGYLATLAEPTYGTQMQDFAVSGHRAEYRLQIDYTEVPVTLSGGQVVSLRQPTYTATDLGYGPLHPDAMLSPRVTPQMIGLGLLEAIPAADILALADPNDADSDGISGRANIVWSQEYNMPMLGRFGLKAGMPTIREQSAGAFAGDIGISNPIFGDPFGDCSTIQDACVNAPHGAGDVRGFEIDAEGLDLVTFYSQNLAVPARRDPERPPVVVLQHEVRRPRRQHRHHHQHQHSPRHQHRHQLQHQYSHLLRHLLRHQRRHQQCR